MLFYSEERWAYMLGIVAPTGWLLLILISGGSGAFLRQMRLVLHDEPPTYPAFLVGGIACILSVFMAGACLYRWRREFTGLGKSMSTFIISAGIVAVYYSVLAIWFWLFATVKTALRG